MDMINPNIQGIYKLFSIKVLFIGKIIKGKLKL